MNATDTSFGQLNDGEPHPAAFDAKQWILDYTRRKDIGAMPRLLEAFYSTGLAGNRLAECCGETLRRLLHGEPVSDRYILGLAWTMKSMEESDV